MKESNSKQIKYKKILPPAYIALFSAALFGASTPASKLLIGQIHPQMLAGLLYLGSGLGLSVLGALSKAKNPSQQETRLKRADVPWLAGAVLFGGIAAPLLLMIGLTTTAAGSASLLLNMEAVLTALLAWFAFKENFDCRIFVGMISIVVGSLVLVWQPESELSGSVGSLAVIAACFCWALDNNFTRTISDADPMQIAAIKGLVSGAVNVVIAFAVGSRFPTIPALITAATVGFLGYGVSLVLFIRALRYMGTARTGAYFSTAPFAGAILSVMFLHESLTISLLIATCFMAFGVWLHLTETHQHEHSHAADEHEHLHLHDQHHQHDHEPGTAVAEPHSHWHKHIEISHSHPHYPDTQHRHDHQDNS